MVIESLRIGGKERQALELFKALRLIPDLDVQVIVLEKKDGSYALPKEGNAFHFGESDENGWLTCSRRIIRFCRSHRPDILHTWGIMPTLYSLPAAKRMNIKVLNGSIRFAIPFRPFSREWLAAKISYRLSNIVVANSLAGLRAQGQTDPQKCYVVHNGFDWERTRTRSTVPVPGTIPEISTRYAVGMVGSFNDAKDHATFIDAATRVLRARKDVTFLCVGEGPNLQAIRDAVPKEYSAFIHFTGKLDPVEPLERMLDVGVLACNTKGHAEGISNTIMEYMAFAKPVVATDSGGNREIIEDHVTGFLTRPFAAADLAARISALLDNEDLRRKMGNAGKERIDREFSVTRMSQKYLGLYRKMLHA